jgi:hypothetical protein
MFEDHNYLQSYPFQARCFTCSIFSIDSGKYKWDSVICYQTHGFIIKNRIYAVLV